MFLFLFPRLTLIFTVFKNDYDDIYDENLPMKELTILGSSTEFCFSDKASTWGSKSEKFSLDSYLYCMIYIRELHFLGKSDIFSVKTIKNSQDTRYFSCHMNHKIFYIRKWVCK